MHVAVTLNLCFSLWHTKAKYRWVSGFVQTEVRLRTSGTPRPLRPANLQVFGDLVCSLHLAYRRHLAWIDLASIAFAGDSSQVNGLETAIGTFGGGDKWSFPVELGAGSGPSNVGQVWVLISLGSGPSGLGGRGWEPELTLLWAFPGTSRASLMNTIFFKSRTKAG